MSGRVDDPDHWTQSFDVEIRGSFAEDAVPVKFRIHNRSFTVVMKPLVGPDSFHYYALAGDDREVVDPMNATYYVLALSFPS
jgi:hypothetical protein